MKTRISNRLRPINKKRAAILGDLLHQALVAKKLDHSQWEYLKKSDQRAADRELADAKEAVQVFYERYLPEEAADV